MVSFLVCGFARGSCSLPFSTSVGGIDVSHSGFIPLFSSRLGRRALKDGKADVAAVVPSAGAAPAPLPSKRTKMSQIKTSKGR